MTPKFGFTSSNSAESLNHMIEKIKCFPYFLIISELVNITEEIIIKRRDELSKLSSILIPKALEIIKFNQEKSTYFHVKNTTKLNEFKITNPSSMNSYKIINSDTKRCSCKQFEHLRLPCAHYFPTRKIICF